MKRTILIIGIAVSLFYCKTKKKATDSASSGVKTGAKSELEIAQKRWTGTTTADLNEGKNIFDTKCTRCHGAKNIVTRSEESWNKAIDKMAPKAKLTAEEKDKLTRYILSYREAHTTTD
jgi:cytochrome c5